MITNKIHWATEISPEETLDRALAGALVVDLRELMEVDELVADVPNIIHIPLSKLEDRFMELPHDRELVMISKYGERSLKATYFLIQHGYENVLNMQYGLVRWIMNGLPTKGNIQSVIKVRQNSNGSAGLSISFNDIPRRN